MSNPRPFHWIVIYASLSKKSLNIFCSMPLPFLTSNCDYVPWSANGRTKKHSSELLHVFKYISVRFDKMVTTENKMIVVMVVWVCIPLWCCLHLLASTHTHANPPFFRRKVTPTTKLDLICVPIHRWHLTTKIAFGSEGNDTINNNTDKWPPQITKNVHICGHRVNLPPHAHNFALVL